MNVRLLICTAFIISCCMGLQAQKKLVRGAKDVLTINTSEDSEDLDIQVINVPVTLTDESVRWTTPERHYSSSIWNNQVVTNVSTPQMLMFYPEKPNGTAVIIAPGGGLYAHSINTEGHMVAEWLAEQGVLGIVLKYRLVPTGEDGVAEIMKEAPSKIKERVAPILPLSISDGLNALTYVREHASELYIDPDKIGFMGFSAGGAVTMGVGYNYDDNNRPNFLAPIYPWTTAYPVQAVPSDAPPMFLVCSSDDPLGLALGTVDLYSSWQQAGKAAELHMYATGGHGYGMSKNNVPSDTWIDRFGDWLVMNGWMEKKVSD